jgi:hypothetical protein
MKNMPEDIVISDIFLGRYMLLWILTRKKAGVHRPGKNERLQKTIENIIINLLQNAR